ncbi:DnaT-like ssDNA-binding protein [Dyadobacter bucti]|uniref:DnaT-like ssDNA-binding protein n=1 Tax=Dyadobacter bucti TaxID=2572203 RepID=UPI001109A62D|nr:DnaT-like ssDNA-binding protein [Dyadobacter bucti]
MPFTVEDGSIVEGANSLCSLDYANAFHSDRGNTSWTGTDAVKEASLIKATDYINQKYSFRGRLVEYDQPLVWPRACIAGVEYDTIPTRVKAAVAELALEALTGSLSPSISPQGQVKSKKVDVIEIEYFASASANTKRPAIDGLLRPYLSGSGINVPVVRV